MLRCAARAAATFVALDYADIVIEMLPRGAIFFRRHAAIAPLLRYGISCLPFTPRDAITLC